MKVPNSMLEYPQGPDPGAGLPKVLGRGVATVWSRPLLSVLGFGLLGLLIAAGCVVPYLNFLFLLTALAPLFGGFPIVSLHLVDGHPIPWHGLFAGFRRYERFLGLFWVGYLHLIFLSAPLLMGLWLNRHFTTPGLEALVLVISGGIALVLILVVFSPYLFVPFLAADLPKGIPLGEIFSRSAELTRGHRVLLTGRVLLLLFIGLSGLLLAGFGAFLTLPIALCALAAQYRLLKPRDEKAK